MSESAKSESRRKAARPGQLWLRLPDLVRDALYETVIGAGLACVDEVLEAERVSLCGGRYVHLAERQALRAGHAASSLVLGGRRVAVLPRVSLNGKVSRTCSRRSGGEAYEVTQYAEDSADGAGNSRRAYRSLTVRCERPAADACRGRPGVPAVADSCGGPET